MPLHHMLFILQQARLDLTGETITKVPSQSPWIFFDVFLRGSWGERAAVVLDCSTLAFSTLALDSIRCAVLLICRSTETYSYTRAAFTGTI